MKSEKLEYIAHQIMGEHGGKDLELAINSYSHRIKRADRPDFFSSTCVNLYCTDEGKIVIVNHAKNNQFYDKLNKSIKSFIESGGLRCISTTADNNCTTYFLCDEVSFFEAECLIKGLDPETTTVHELGCMKYLVDPETTSPTGLKCIKYGLNPGAGYHELHCIEFGLDPSTTTKKQLHLFTRNNEPVIPEIQRILQTNGSTTPAERKQALRRHYYNCDITDAEVKEVRCLCQEFPANYRMLIPLHFKLKRAVEEEDYEYAVKLRGQIGSILLGNKIREDN